jgi:lysophospholipase L1-like esterase
MRGAKKKSTASKTARKGKPPSPTRPVSERPARKKAAPPGKVQVARTTSPKRAAHGPRTVRALRVAGAAGLQPARVVSVGEVLAADPTTASLPYSPEFTHRLLAEGDSWFSINAVPGTNLLHALTFEHPTIILNIAEPGDRIVRMSTLVKNPWMRKFTTEPNFAASWDLLLLSGGGNDLIDSLDAILKTPAVAGSTDPVDYVDALQLADLIENIQKGFRRLADLRGQPGSTCAGKPIVTHMYDYVTPRPSPTRFFFGDALGPWLLPALEAKGAPAEVHTPVARLLLGRLGDAIHALAEGPERIENFHVVRTREALTPAPADAKGPVGDWENEIHPSAEGYRRLSELVSPRVRSLLSSDG